jgi:NAD(P)H dehydrogenase (quinone)
MGKQGSILVTGARGALGGQVVAELIGSGRRVIAGTRDPDRADPGIQSVVEVRRIDFDDPASLASGFARVERLLIVSTDELSAPGKRQRQHAAALYAAVEAGVSFVAYTSMPDPANSPDIPFAPDHQAMETALHESGLAHAVLRNGWYQENLLAYLPQIVADGTWFTAAGNGRMPYVARADAARAAAAVLSGARAGIFDIAGTAVLSVEDIAAEVHETLGRPLVVTHADPDRVALELARQGVAAPVISMVASTEAHQRAGGFEVGAGHVEQLTGRPPLPLRDLLLTQTARFLGTRR